MLTPDLAVALGLGHESAKRGFSVAPGLGHESPLTPPKTATHPLRPNGGYPVLKQAGAEIPPAMPPATKECNLDGSAELTADDHYQNQGFNT